MALIKCQVCNGMEFQLITNGVAIDVVCWICGGVIKLPELYCMEVGHIISTEDSERLNQTKTNGVPELVPLRLETNCSRCNAVVVARQSPVDKTKYHVTAIEKLE